MTYFADFDTLSYLAVVILTDAWIARQAAGAPETLAIVIDHELRRFGRVGRHGGGPEDDRQIIIQLLLFFWRGIANQCRHGRHRWR